MSLRVVCISHQIGHYHHARYFAAYKQLDSFFVIDVTGSAEFNELINQGNKDYPRSQLFSSFAEYEAAVKSGRLNTVLGNCLAELKPDVLVVSGWAFPESYAAINWANKKKVPAVVMSESQLDDAVRRSFREWLKRRFVSKFGAALVGAESHKKYLASLGFDSASVFFGYNAIDNDHFSSGAAEARQNASDYSERFNLPDNYILASARFIEKKNLPHLVRSFAKADLQDCHLIILGDGPLRESIEVLIESLRVRDRVHLPGFKSYDLLPIYYSLSIGFVHVSTTEQWGLVINEAAAAGVPIVASDACGAARAFLAHGETGFIVDAKCEEQLVDSLKSLCRMSSTNRQEMGLAATARVQEWGPKRFGVGMSAAVEHALENKVERRGLIDRTLFEVLSRFRINKVQ